MDKIYSLEDGNGLKSYITNSKLSISQVVNNYTQLWQIEKAFRISKTDLRVRPIYHRLKNRIEAHICIAFVAYTIYKELERILSKNSKNKKSFFSTNRAIELTKNIYKVTYTLPDSRKQKTKFLKLDDEQKILVDLIKND